MFLTARPPRPPRTAISAARRARIGSGIELMNELLRVVIAPGV